MTEEMMLSVVAGSAFEFQAQSRLELWTFIKVETKRLAEMNGSGGSDVDGWNFNRTMVTFTGC